MSYLDNLDKYFDLNIVINTPQKRVLLIASSDIAALTKIIQTYAYEQLTFITAIDLSGTKQIELVYQFTTLNTNKRLELHTHIAYEKLFIATISHMWPQAIFYEQELHEGFGIEFLGHDIKSDFVLKNTATKHPLRK